MPPENEDVEVAETETVESTGETPDQPETGSDEWESAKQRLNADLAKERRERKKATETIDRLRAALDETQAKSQTSVAEVQAALADAEKRALRLQVALEEGLPADLAKRLVGDDEDELRADAKTLAAMVRKPKSDARTGSAAAAEPKANPNDLLRAYTGAG